MGLMAMSAILQSALERTLPPKIDYGIAFVVCDILWAGLQEAITGTQTPRQALHLMEEKVREVLT